MKTISVEDCLTPDVSWGDCLAEIPYLYYVRDMNVFNRHLIMTMAGKLTLEDFLTRYPNHTEESYYYYVKNYYKTSYEPLLIFGLEEGYRYKDYIEYCIELIEQWEGVDYAIPILEWQAVPASGKTFEDYDALFEGKEYAMDRLIVVFGSGVSKGNVSVDYILNTSYDYPGTQFCDSVTDLTADLFELVRIQSRYKTKESYLEKGGSEEKWEKAQAVDLTNYRRILVYHLKEEYQNRETLQEIIYRIGNQPARFELALPDYEWKVQMASVPTDPYYPDQAAAFGLIDLPQAWPVAAAETASSVKVAVMDSGIDYLHPDLAGRVDTSLSYDFSDPLNVRPDPYPSDSFGHGTRVACVLGAVTNNSIGMAGACPNVELVSYKVLHEDENGQQRCWATSFAAALAQCTSDEIPIANLSWGFDIASENKTETQLLWEFLVNDGVLTVHAAGNGILNNEAGTDLDSIEDYIGPGTAFVDLTSREYVPLYPSLLPGPVDNLISVGACTLTDEPADFSNYGASSVDLFAPGEDIVTSAGNGYSADSYGTSFAAPFVTAAAAMLKAMNPALTSAQIKQILLSTADTDAAYSGKCTSGGRLNVLNAVLTQHTHTHTYQNLGVLNGHMERCTECGISCTEAHSWTNFGLQFRCYKCGVVSAGIPVDLNVVGIQPEETVFASLKRRTFFGLA
ncbi:MAG: S8 family serine peptidase [Lachnospiraceae bacterium]|nr:S8 family serine peptidase [Lachnospiraceae bacterium]